MNDRTWDRLSGLVVGAALGVLAGILLAPSAGSETRGSIKKKTQDSLDQIQKNVRDIRESLTQKGQALFKKSVTEIPLDDNEDPHEDQGA
ncbi:YtxH domain-containing protein [Sulfobacillus thermosulfidooxidans]|uniref:YtxH domain-containing protein n=1 Tax=Sulfobacillus thermosulfidooxidans TaxID=28034 RepID=A0A2T2X1X4_SULTH|nr:YtxH domain-containing protein [Sulfobacillus thermosulfidooxidans]PSR28491.1 MAG: YtxH domain-containing protein [Sulfobacillus thermosulfidooxidans]